MFESAEAGAAVDKATWEAEVPALRERLLAVQKRIPAADLSVLTIVSGAEGAGKGETVNLLLEWMDARGIRTHAFWTPSDEERERPPLWRYWRVLPARGQMGIFFGSWYTQPIVERVFGRIDRREFETALERIVELENMLSSEGMLLVKLWLHLSKKTQKRRFQRLTDDPRNAWRVSQLDRKFFKHYDRFRQVSEQALERTNTSAAPWKVIEAEDERHRGLAVGRHLLQTLEGAVAAQERGAAAPPAEPASRPGRAPPNPIRALDLSVAVDDKSYKRRLERLQGELNRWTRELHERQRSMILVFEGPDAAGKGGAIRRLTQAIDARGYQVISIAAPTDEERAHPYLWRFWRHLPRLGRVTIYDRSWYGRVLVERVEGFCAPEDWQRAFAEINAFERQLTDFGTIVVKFWLAISPQMQLLRFREREKTPYKQYKITEEDWRNREKWEAYERAAGEMIERTGSRRSPWVLVEADDKNHARLAVLESTVKALRKGLR